MVQGNPGNRRKYRGIQETVGGTGDPGNRRRYRGIQETKGGTGGYSSWEIQDYPENMGNTGGSRNS